MFLLFFHGFNRMRLHVSILGLSKLHVQDRIKGLFLHVTAHHSYITNFDPCSIDRNYIFLFIFLIYLLIYAHILPHFISAN